MWQDEQMKNENTSEIRQWILLIPRLEQSYLPKERSTRGTFTLDKIIELMGPATYGIFIIKLNNRKVCHPYLFGRNCYKDWQESYNSHDKEY